MTKYNGNINNVLQGVSQQARRDRRPEQVASQVNCLSSVTKGLINRPGSRKTVEDFELPGFETAAKHTYDRGDGTERYTLVCDDESIRVVDLLTGNGIPAITEETTYLEDDSGLSKDPKDYLKFYTIADTTLVANTTKTPAMNNPTDEVAWQYVLHCVKADYGLKYKIRIAGGAVIATYNAPATVTPGSGNVDKSIYLKTSDVMDGLYTGGLSAWIATNGISADYNGVDTIVMTHATAEFVLEASDTLGNKDLKLISNVSNKYEDLPVNCIDKYKVKIVGEDEEVDNDYYVEFNGDREKRDVVTTEPVTGTLVRTDSGTANTPSPYNDDSWVGSLYTPEETGYPTGIRWAKGYCYVEGYATGERFTGGEGGTAYTTNFSTNIRARLEVWTGSAWEVSAYKKVTDGTVVPGVGIKIACKVTATADITKSRMRIQYGQTVITAPLRQAYLRWSVTKYEYKTYIASAGTVCAGYWKECAGFGVNQSFDASTMPHKITRVSEGSFDLDPIEWIDRLSGDNDSNPEPSFVGNKIQDIGLYQSRLVFASEENIIGSVTYDHFNIFAPSVRNTSDDDPIDTTSSDNQVTNLAHILIFNSALVVFSDKAQFLHTPGSPFTSSSFGLASKSRYSVDVSSRPVASASSMFFPYKYGEYTGIREYKVDLVTDTASAEAVTNHVPEFLDGRCKQIVSSTDYDMLLVRTDNEPKKVYVYQWYYQDAQRKQAAWHEWEFNTDIEYVEIIQDTLYIWVKHEDDFVAFFEIDLAISKSNELEFALSLDNHSEVLATSYDADYWQVLRDYTSLNADSWNDIEVIGGSNSGIEGAKTAYTPLSDSTGVLIPKSAIPNPTGTPSFYIGTVFNSSAIITNPYVRDTQGKPKTSTRTILKTMKFNVSETGYFKVTVDKMNAPTFVREYTSKIIGSTEYLLNSQAPLQDVGLGVPIRNDASRCTITVSSDSHLPFRLLDIDWLCNYKDKGRRTI